MLSYKLLFFLPLLSTIITYPSGIFFGERELPDSKSWNLVIPKFDDFILLNYEPHNPIKAELSVGT